MFISIFISVNINACSSKWNGREADAMAITVQSSIHSLCDLSTYSSLYISLNKLYNEEISEQRLVTMVTDSNRIIVVPSVSYA